MPPSLAGALPFMLIVFAALMALYAWSAPPSVVLEDDGEFIAAVHFMGVAHPPGFPLFVLLAKPFTWMATGSVAYRVHLASGCFAALACVALWWIVRTLTGRALIALIAALAFGVSDVFWSQAIIADVYSLNALLFFAGLALCLTYIHRPHPALVSVIALVLGLGLSNHWPLFLLAAPALLVVLLPARRALVADLRNEPIIPVVLFIAAVLVPYTWMVRRTQAAPDLSFLSGITSIDGFREFVTRAGYAQSESSATAGVSDQLRFLGFLARETLWQFTPGGAALAAAGLVGQWTRVRTSIGVALLFAFAGATLVLLSLIRWDYDFLLRAAFRVYPIVPYGIVAIWMGLGLAWSIDRVGALAPRARRMAPWAVYAVAGGLVAALVVTNAPRNNRRGYTFARDYATALLESFEPNAVVFTHSDVDANTLNYFHFVEGMRQDIRLMNDQGLGISPDGRLFDPVGLTQSQKDDRLASFARTSGRPVYFLGYAPNTLSDLEFGFYRKIDLTPRPQVSSRLQLDARLVEYVRRVMASPRPVDLWTIDYRNMVLRQIARPLTAIVDFKGEGAESYRADLERVSQEFPGLLSRLQLLEQQKAMPPAQLLSLVEKNEQLVNDTISRKDVAALRDLKTRIRNSQTP